MASTFAYGVLPMEGPSSSTLRGTIRLCSLRDAVLPTPSISHNRNLCQVTNGPYRNHNRGQRICSQRVDDEVVRCSTLWNRTSGSLIIAFLTAEDALRMPFAYWPIAGTAYSQPPPPPTRAAECRDHGECVYNTS